MSNVILSERESSLALVALRYYKENERCDDQILALEKKLESAEKIKITIESPNDYSIGSTSGAHAEKNRPSEYSYFYVMIEDEQWPYTTDDEEFAAQQRMKEKGVKSVSEFGINAETNESEELRQISLPCDK